MSSTKEKTFYKGIEDPRFLKLITMYDKDNKVIGYKTYNKGGAVMKKKTKMMAKGGMAKKKTKMMAKGGKVKKTKMMAKGGKVKGTKMYSKGGKVSKGR